MEPARTVSWLALATLVLALVAAGAGLSWQAGDGSASVVSVHGEEVELYGHGLYRHDTTFGGAGNRGTDLATLVLAVPALGLALAGYRRGSLRAGVLLTGVLSWQCYVWASRALGSAYTELFLLWIAVAATSGFALVLALRALGPRVLAACVPLVLPYRRIAAFLLACAALTTFVWLEPLVRALVTGEPPALLDHNTTLVTDVLDLAIVIPLLALSGILALRRDARGIVVALPLLVVLLFLAPTIATQTAFQLDAGVEFTTAEIVGPIAGFLLLGVLDLFVLRVLLRPLGGVEAREPAVPPSVPGRLRQPV